MRNGGVCGWKALGVSSILVLAACGKTMPLRTAETLPASGGGSNSAPAPQKSDADVAKASKTGTSGDVTPGSSQEFPDVPGGNSTGTPTETSGGTPGPGSSSDTYLPPAPGDQTPTSGGQNQNPGSTAGDMGGSAGSGGSMPPTQNTTPEPPPRQFVTAGGTVSGFLEDGGVYFAPNDSFFFTASFASLAGVTTVWGELHFKEAKLNPAADIKSFIHAGPCSNDKSTKYQHIAGNATPQVSEIHIPLVGTGTEKKGTGTGNFNFRNEAISWVIEFEGAPGKRFCADLAVKSP